MPTNAPATPLRAPKDFVLGFALLSLATLGTVWFVRRAPEPPPRPAVSDVLLEGTFPFRDGVVAQRIRVNEPTRLEIRIEEPGETFHAWFGPPQPVEAGPVDTPDPARAVRWDVTAEDAPHVETVLAYGLYVLRVDRVQRSTTALRAAAPSVHVVVRALPVR